MALSISPSEFFDGVDGMWSSFFIQVGTQPQQSRVLPGTSASAGTATWVILPEGCSDYDLCFFSSFEDCMKSRGSGFTRNASATWSTQNLTNEGLFNLVTPEESALGLTGNAYYGFDTIQLGLAGSGAPVVQKQLIAGIATNDFWLGSLGLSPINFNFSNLNHPYPSLMSSLRTSSIIPSSTWAYTAGASYKDPPAFGSLVLGGYDATRFNASQTLYNVPFYEDFSRDLLVGLRSITYETAGKPDQVQSLMSDSVFVFIDSMVSHLWLPINDCLAFEQHFNLTWNASAELYLIDEPTHQALVEQNPTFTFALAVNLTSTETVSIKIPYAAFDLNVTYPLFEGDSRYFPLKRAANSSQYTLGRAFLQEAHVIADYDRGNFSISQALFPPTGTSQQLVAIMPPRSTASPHISKFVWVGVGIAVFLSINVVGFVGRWACRVHRRARERASMLTSLTLVDDAKPMRAKRSNMLSKPELGSEMIRRLELSETDSQRLELSGLDTARYEKDAPMTSVQELSADERLELEAPGIAASELDIWGGRSPGSIMYTPHEWKYGNVL